MSLAGHHSAFGHAAPPSKGSNGLSQSLFSNGSTLSSSSSRHPSQISKIYRQASTLFLTRRLPEALTTLLPLITPPEPASEGEPAPVARASKTTRVKIWSLYLTILNAIVELEPEEGKDAFGTQEWRSLCNKVRDGLVWEEITMNGYHGVEGDVDADVVINLATLLLAHARDQIFNQRKLEAYFASSSQPNLDIAGRLAQSPTTSPRMSSRHRSPAKGTSGANTPRDLNARVKILELYTLHVLLRNNEWEYAREFISASDVLDDERREAFLQALESLHEEQLQQEWLEQEERRKQEEALQRDLDEAKRLRAENEERERKRLEEQRARREGSEVDYGVDDNVSQAGSSRKGHTRTLSNSSARKRLSGMKANGKVVAAPTFTSRATMILSRAHRMVMQLSQSLKSNPLLLVRLLAFIAGIVVMMGNRAIRQRVQRVLSTSWNKIKATAGMGVKVSYI